jgi:4-diphosphocytidyl-2-C-methyl-D-erythritol kinase
MPLIRESPCKVNLILNILGKRPDGFHELETVMQPVALCDTLEFSERHSGIELSCSNPTLAVDSTNLVHRAADAFFRKTGIDRGIRIHLEKRIPLAAGLGGGSGNAASTLEGLNELFGGPISGTELGALAAELGSDVPFFLQSKPALAVGRGEQITGLDFFPALRGMFILLIHPGFGIPTAWAYQSLARFPEMLSGSAGRAARLIELLQTSDLGKASAGFFNSLEAPALMKYPVLAVYQAFLKSNGALATLMSGSGSTTFAIATGKPECEELRNRFKSEFGGACWTAVVPL